jgi:hypothetical protein
MIIAIVKNMLSAAIPIYFLFIAAESSSGRLDLVPVRSPQS